MNTAKPGVPKGSRSRATAGFPSGLSPGFKKFWVAVWWAIVGGVVLELLYVVVVNLALGTGMVQKLTSSSESAQIDFSSAWTWWPGHVHVTSFLMRVQDHNMQFVLTLEQADVTIRLRDLFARTFHATKVRGSGVVFRFRSRIQPEQAYQPTVRALPPIPGFSDPPLREALAPSPPVSEESYKLWSVHLEDVDVGLRELWVQEFRYVGDGRATGAFLLRPALHVWVSPAVLDLNHGEVSVADFSLMRSLEGHIECTVHPFDVRIVKGKGIFSFVTAHAHLMGQITDAAVTPLYLSPNSGVRIDDASGMLSVDAGLDRGNFIPGSAIVFQTEHVVVTTPIAKTQGKGTLQVRVVQEDNGVVSIVDARIPHTKMYREGSPAILPLNMVDATAQARVLMANGTEPKGWSFADGHVSVSTLEAPDLRWFNGISPEEGSWQFEGGSASLNAHLVITQDQQLAGTLQAVLSHVAGAVGAMEIKADATLAQATLHSFRLHEKTGRVQASVEATGVSTHGALWKAQAETASAAFHTSTDENNERVSHGHVQASLKGASGHIGDTTWSANSAVRIDLTANPTGERVAQGTASVHVDNANFHSGTQGVKGWWAHVDWDPISIQKAPVFTVRSNLHARLKDGVPFLALLATEDQIPEWVPTILHLNGLTLNAQLEHRGTLTDLQLLNASGGPLVGRGRLQHQNKTTRGAFLLEASPLSLGIAINGSKTSFALLAGEHWLNEQLMPLQGAP